MGVDLILFHRLATTITAKEHHGRQQFSFGFTGKKKNRCEEKKIGGRPRGGWEGAVLAPFDKIVHVCTLWYLYV
jgi:hypothetical protein